MVSGWKGDIGVTGAYEQILIGTLGTEGFFFSFHIYILSHCGPLVFLLVSIYFIGGFRVYWNYLVFSHLFHNHSPIHLSDGWRVKHAQRSEEKRRE